ncbi:hypothetical protein MiSe_49590 [Microseira wollei NIES-4236]|uniref:Transposase n=1 Tax=Microseira wollei NIES-4236 TaxID=2530354 RepID=A0AAV3XHD5_9CYAN|nr:hypothetical protein MiSe_49590 [Microseira wollei NIES-4236]
MRYLLPSIALWWKGNRDDAATRRRGEIISSPVVETLHVMSLLVYLGLTQHLYM